MEVSVQAVGAESFEQIRPLLRHFETATPHLNEIHWRRLFHYPWEVPDETRVFALLNGSKFVGFEAFIQHRRIIDGERRWIVNGSSWVVLPEFRKYSLLIKEPWMRLHDRHPDLIATGLTTKRGFERMHLNISGGTILDTHQYVLCPLLDGSGTFWKASSDPNAILRVLGQAERQIYLDHKDLPCHHLVVWRGDETCYVVAVRRPGPKGMAMATLLYVSSPALFRRCLDAIKIGLYREMGTLWTSADERFFGGWRPRLARRVPLRSVRTFRGGTLAPSQIDNLYSELVLLEL